MSQTPGLLGSYARAVAGVAPLPRRPQELGDDERTADGIEVDRHHLAAYARVCGLRLRDALPATYVHVLAFPLSMSLMTARSFPFGVLGLVHVANRIEQERPVSAAERLDLRVSAAHLREHERGRAVDVVGEATVDGELVWRGVSTYLRIERRSGGEGPGRERREPPTPQAVWRVPGDTGRRYADVSGDRNPIHLHALTAKAFGMPRAIAHGRWVKARCLAALEDTIGDAYEVDVRFKLPLSLPGTVVFSAAPDGRFAVRSAKDGKPHLGGAVTPGG